MLRRLLLILSVVVVPLGASLQVEVTSSTAIVMNADTGAILYAKGAYDTMYPASTTKVATALYALERGGAGLSLDAIIVVDQESVASISSEAKKRAGYRLPPYWLEFDGSSLGLVPGEKVRFKDLLFGMMLASGNDAANLVAKHSGGTITQFMEDLNAYLKGIGCKDTEYLNPHGLHHPGHKTTAYDLAVMTRRALQIPFFRQMVSTARYTKPASNKHQAKVLYQTNRLMRSKKKEYYPKAIGVKTGYTSAAGKCLVAAATQGDRTLIVVVLKCKGSKRFPEVIELFKAAFAEAKISKRLLPAGPQKFAAEITGGKGVTKTYIDSEARVAYYPSEKPELIAEIHWDDLVAPVAKGQRVGEVRFVSSNSEFALAVPLLAAETAEAALFFSLKQKLSQVYDSPLWFKGASLTALFVLWFSFRRRQRH